MNKLILLLLAFISIACVTDNQQSITNKDISKFEQPKTIILSEVINIDDELYNLQIKIGRTESSTYNLMVSMELKNDSYFVSPNSKRDFKGKFFIDLGSYSHLEFKGDIIETPRSVEEFDPHPFVNGYVNWVRINTTYKQSLQIKSLDDFKVFGRIRFTIEPRCSLEEIPFAISYENGIMKLYSPKC